MKSRPIFSITIVLASLAGFSQDAKIDSLKSELPKVQGSKKIELLHALTISHWLTSPDSARKYAKQAIQLSQQLQNKKLLAISFRLLGAAYSYQGEYDTDRYYTGRALDLSVEINDSVQIASTLNNMGATFLTEGSYSEALELLLRAYTIKLKSKQKKLGTTLNNIGSVFLKLKDYTNALKYFNEASRNAVQISDEDARLNASNNIGLTYLEMNDLSGAERFLKQSLEISSQTKNKNWHATALDGLGQVYFKMNQLQKSRANLNQALAIRKEISDRRGISETSYHLSLYLSKTKPDSAFYFLRMSQRIAESIHANDRILENVSLFRDLFVARGRFDSALRYQSLYSQLLEKQFMENSNRSIQGIQFKMKEEEAEQQLTAQKIELARKTELTNFLVVIAILMLISAVIILRYYTIQKQLGRRLSISNQKMVIQNNEITKKNTELSNLNSEKNNLIGIVAHDLKSPLNQIRGLISLMKKLPQTPTNDSATYMQMIEASATRLSELITKILDVEAIESKMQTQLTNVDFSDTLNSIVRLAEIQAKEKQINIIQSIENGVIVLADVSHLNQVIENLISNAVKFSPLGKNIYINLTKNERDAICEIKDEGPGLTESDKALLFKKYQRLSATPTGNESSTGLGLSIVKKFVEAMNGEIWCESEARKGASFFVKLSLAKT